MTRRILIAADADDAADVARELLARGVFAVRALAADANGADADALRTLGAEVVGGALDDRPSIRAALKGCCGAVVHASGEAQQSRNVVTAAAGAEIEHLIYIGTRDGDLEAYARNLGLAATFVPSGDIPSIADVLHDVL